MYVQPRVQSACYAPPLCCCLTGDGIYGERMFSAGALADGQSAIVACVYTDIFAALPATSHTFVSHASCEEPMFGNVGRKIPTIIGRIAMRFFTGVHDPQRMNHRGFSTWIIFLWNSWTSAKWTGTTFCTVVVLRGWIWLRTLPPL